jgi:uncharacterized protein YjbI with pentapeptide repeats
MALLPSIRDAVRGIGKNLGNALDARMGNSDEPADMPSMSAEAKALFDYKRDALDMAKQMASERGSPATMTDYFIAAQRIGESRADEMAAQGIQWTPAVIADLSGQRIDGFEINKEELQPRREAIMLASARARDAAVEEGRPATLVDTLQELQKIQQSGEHVPSIEDMKDEMDLDGDHTIAFYEVIDHHADFKGTVFANTSFHPAGTLMRGDENGVALTEGASFENVTFDGMSPDDHLQLARGDYENIHFTNIRGGEIEVMDGTQIDGMDIRGAHASLTIGHASVSRLDARDANIVTLHAAPGAEINQAIFQRTTIDMASELEGSTWRNVQIKDSNLVELEGAGMKLYNVSISNTKVDGWDLTGATIENMTVDGKPVRSPEALTAMGITVDSDTTIAVTPEFDRKYELAQIREDMQKQLGTIGSPIAPAAEAPQASAAAIEAPTVASAARAPLAEAPAAGFPALTELPPLRLAVADTSLDEALSGKFNEGKDMVGKVQPELTPGISMPGSND